MYYWYPIDHPLSLGFWSHPGEDLWGPSGDFWGGDGDGGRGGMVKMDFGGGGGGGRGGMGKNQRISGENLGFWASETYLSDSKTLPKLDIFERTAWDPTFHPNKHVPWENHQPLWVVHSMESVNRFFFVHQANNNHMSHVHLLEQ